MCTNIYFLLKANLFQLKANLFFDTDLEEMGKMLVCLKVKITRKSNYINVTLCFRQGNIDFKFPDV